MVYLFYFAPYSLNLLLSFQLGFQHLLYARHSAAHLYAWLIILICGIEGFWSKGPAYRKLENGIYYGLMYNPD